MRYRSTRADPGGRTFSFTEVMLGGLAPDGGLFLPESWPQLDDVEALAGKPFAEVSARVLQAFAPDLPGGEAEAVAQAAYARFGHPAVAPLVQHGADDFLLELFHGPTLAFKDVAMQLLGRLFERALERAGRRMTIVAATSGDTGGAAIEALAGLSAVRVCVLHPKGRISEVQRRFMTTVTAPNVLNVAVEGTFDDCQALVKAMFADDAFRDEVSLGAVNSINWARIVAQAAYYVTSSLHLARGGAPVSYCVPTGNFGDVFAGLVAKRMGAPVGRLIVATNENDILDRALRTGLHEPKGVAATTSPSMDIQVSSNFERLLFEASDGDAATVRALMAHQAGGRGFDLSAAMRSRIGEEFSSYAASGEAVDAAMRDVREATGMTIDPHTAVGLHAAAQAREDGLEGPLVTLATAHPAKFPDAVEAATGYRPGLPPRLDGLMGAKERYDALPADLGVVQNAVRELAGR
ncbi:threonine synthase [Parvularcula dongshanensis]|uniref:Threonine synthase n=1 Tax=Parvularcula dongshanensis TaxID=1173995 RepID=A0A840I099_9PROT|nr:threonine synthase [Parvularcula dongshanensis]MBB4658496.1 threonine synthase [Parvularcula dongshanensis]